jgi:hypothetical protein
VSIRFDEPMGEMYPTGLPCLEASGTARLTTLSGGPVGPDAARLETDLALGGAAAGPAQAEARAELVERTVTAVTASRLASGAAPCAELPS